MLAISLNNGISSSSIVAMLDKISVQIARAIDEMNDIQMAARPVLVGIAHENYIIAKCDAAVIRPEFGPCPSKPGNRASRSQ